MGLFLGRKAMTNLDSILESRDITLPSANKGLSSQKYGLSSSRIWMWELVRKKTDRQRIDAFKLWCWRRLLKVPYTARSSSQSVLKEINPECSLEGLMLKWKLWYFGHLIQRADNIGQDPDAGRLRAGGEGGNREWYGWTPSPTLWTWILANSGAQWRTGKPDVLQSMGSQRVGHDLATEWQWWVILAFSGNWL